MFIYRIYWTIVKPESYVTGVLPKSTNPQHIKENIDIFDLQLNKTDMEEICCLSKNTHYCWDPSAVVWKLFTNFVNDNDSVNKCLLHKVPIYNTWKCIGINLVWNERCVLSNYQFGQG